MSTYEQTPVPFEILVSGKPYLLELGRCAIALFRSKQEVDYISLDLSEDDNESVMRIFDNQQFVRWVAGYEIQTNEDGELIRETTYMEEEESGERKTFREVTGWNPPVIEKDKPYEWEEDMWIEVQTRNIEKELDDLDG